MSMHLRQNIFILCIIWYYELMKKWRKKTLLFGRFLHWPCQKLIAIIKSVWRASVGENSGAAAVAAALCQTKKNHRKHTHIKWKCMAKIRSTRAHEQIFVVNNLSNLCHWCVDKKKKKKETHTTHKKKYKFANYYQTSLCNFH